MLATSHPPFAFKYPRALGDAGKMLTATLASAFAVRNLGPTALQLAYVACGRLDVFWEFGPDGLNCYGPALLIRLAGGTVTAADGSPYGIDADGIIAAPPGAHASMLLQMNDTLD